MDSIIVEYKMLLLALLSTPQLPFNNALRGSLPEGPGVYRIFERRSSWRKSIYVARTNNLRRQIYSIHLMSKKNASTLKRKLITAGEFNDETAVKKYLQERCAVQVLVLKDERVRNLFTHFAVSVLRPHFDD